MSTLPFADLKLSPEILRAVADMGFETATKIQAGCIPLLLEGKDIVGQSETGSGKTAAFVIPLLERVNPKLKAPQALVLVPTRELAVQVASECTKLLSHKRGITVLPVKNRKFDFRAQVARVRPETSPLSARQVFIRVSRGTTRCVNL